MKFTPSTTYNLINKSTARELVYNIYMRETTNLSGSLSLDNWTDVTEYIIDLPDISAKLEYNVGNYTADGVSLTGFDIPFWRSKFTDVKMDDDGIYFEFKITVTPKLGSIVAEVITPFFGFMNQDGMTYDDGKNTVKFSVYTQELLADKTPAYTMYTQYIYDTLRSGSVLILPRIPSLYVKDANYNSLPLKTGLHKLTYDADAETLQLDDGAAYFITSSESVFVLGDANDSDRDLFGDTQQLQIYREGSIVENQNTTMTEYLIVTSQSAVLPQQTYYSMDLQKTLLRIYTKIGCQYTASDDFIIRSWDGGKRYSYINTPPDDDVSVKVATAFTHDQTSSAYVGIGNKIYETDLTCSAYTLVASCSSNTDDVIMRLLWNENTDYLWAYYWELSSGIARFRPIKRTGVLGGYTYTHRPLPTNTGSFTYAKESNICVYNFEYGLTQVHGLLAVQDLEDSGNQPSVDNGQGLYIFREDVATPSAYRIDDKIDDISAEPESFNCKCLHQYDRKAFVIAELSIGSYLYASTAQPNNGGLWGGLSWVDGDYVTGSGKEFIGQSSPPYIANNPMVWNKNSFEDGFYYYFISGSGNYHPTSVQQIRRTSGSINQLIHDFPRGDYEYVGGQASYGYPVDPSATESRIAMILRNKNDVTENLLTEVFYTYALGNVTSSYIIPQTFSYMLSYLDDTYYFLDPVGQMYNITNIPRLFIASNFQYAELSLREYLNKLLSAFNLLGTINSNKKALVYRRTNESGSVVFSGYSSSLSTENTIDYSMNYENYKSAKIVNLTAEDGKPTSYDGTNFDVGYFSNTRAVDVSSEVIPKILAKDLAAHFYNFFSADRSIVKISSPDMLYQYEPFDACNISLASTKTAINKTGIIYSTSFKKDGTTQMEVLINTAADEPPLSLPGEVIQ